MALISICCSVSLRQAYLNSASTQSNLFNSFHFKGLTVQVFRSVHSNPVECVTFLGASEMNCVSCISWATVSFTPWLPSSWGAWRSSVEIQDCCSQGVTVTFGRRLVFRTDPEGSLKQVSGTSTRGACGYSDGPFLLTAETKETWK